MTDLERLIAKLKAATAGSRELDMEVFFSVEPRYLYRSRRDEYGQECWEINRHGTVMTPVWDDWMPARDVPNYTTSMDAALTMWDTPSLDKGYPRRGMNLLYALLPGRKMAWRAVPWEVIDGAHPLIYHENEAAHRSRPIAAVMAALHARSSRP